MTNEEQNIIILEFEGSLCKTLDFLRTMDVKKVKPCKGQVNYWNEKLEYINCLIKYFGRIAE